MIGGAREAEQGLSHYASIMLNLTIGMLLFAMAESFSLVRQEPCPTSAAEAQLFNIPLEPSGTDLDRMVGAPLCVGEM